MRCGAVPSWGVRNRLSGFPQAQDRPSVKEALLERPPHELSAMVETELPHDPGPLRLDRPDGDAQLARDVTVGVPVREHDRCNAFTFCELHLIEHAHSVA